MWFIWITSLVMIFMALGSGVYGFSKTDKLNPITSSAQAQLTLQNAQHQQILDENLTRTLDTQRRAETAKLQHELDQADAEGDAKVARYVRMTAALPAIVTMLAGSVALLLAGVGIRMARQGAHRVKTSAEAALEEAQERTWLEEERRRLEIREQWLAQQAEQQRQEMARMQQQAHALRLQMRELHHAEMRRQAQEEQAKRQAPPQRDGGDHAGAPAAASSAKIIPGPGNPNYPGRADGSAGSALQSN